MSPLLLPSEEFFGVPKYWVVADEFYHRGSSIKGFKSFGATMLGGKRLVC